MQWGGSAFCMKKLLPFCRSFRPWDYPADIFSDFFNHTLFHFALHSIDFPQALFIIILHLCLMAFACWSFADQLIIPVYGLRQNLASNFNVYSNLQVNHHPLYPLQASATTCHFYPIEVNHNVLEPMLRVCLWYSLLPCIKFPYRYVSLLEEQVNVLAGQANYKLLVRVFFTKPAIYKIHITWFNFCDIKNG